MYLFFYCVLCFFIRCCASGFCIISKFCVSVVEEIKEVELRSRRGKFIYNRTYNFIGLNQVRPLYFRHDKLL